MSVERILEDVSEKRGWNTDSQLEICLEYIGNQSDDSAFEGFLRQKAEEESMGDVTQGGSTMIKCEFTSVWDTGSVVTTPCEYNIETGRTDPEVSKTEPPEGVPVREYITLPDGDELDVCPDCHEYVLKNVIGDRADLSYGEYEECPNPDCTGTDTTS